MTDFLDRISKLSPKRLALLAVELNEKLEDANRRAHEPVAVVGMACRFPGNSDDPGRFWELLRDGRDAIVEVPADRWDAKAWFDPDPDAPGRMSVTTGGFLQNVDQFEPGFFGISPREAQTMDPQQRLLLEVTWQALELAGMAPERLAGSSTGVFVGVCNSDYFQRVLGRGIDTIDAYLASGNAHSVAAGRIAYTLGLQGPAVAIDTACSSSLVALQAACQSLRTGETSMAICGGVNLMCSPETTITLSKSHMLAPDGRCKTFDSRADGFARGEGCGVLLLKRLSDAVAAGDRILAVVRGIATNQDGRSGGLTVPNGPAQEAVIRAALADAGVQPSDVDYVEAHGTGTSLGDPIEVRALAAVYGGGRTVDSPLWVGSVKTNIGHLESAAGIAGVIKVILSLQHERVPQHLHFQQPSPHIPWEQIPVRVPAAGREWQRGSRARIAGVSSFGFSGTNAHAVIEEPPLPTAAAAERAALPQYCLPLSARSVPALREQARRLAGAMADKDSPRLDDVAYTLGVGRSHLSERAAFVVGDVPTASQALRDFAEGRPAPQGMAGSVTPGQRPEVVFLFTGQGSQYPGMARELYALAPVFRETLDRCDAALGADALGRTLKTVLWDDAGDSPAVHETAWTQPALFAVEYAITQLWRSWGVEPAAVIGHSVGEYVAACVAGVFSLEDGLRLIAERGRLMQALPPGGSMAAIFAPAGEVEAAVRPFGDRVAIAAYNAADSVVISGEAAAVDSVLGDFARRNIQGHRLFVSLAAHSPLVSPALDAMQRCAASVQMHPPRVPVAWNVTGGAPLPGGAPDANYWRRHLREPVRFADGLAVLHRDGFRTFLEVGPHPTLVALAQRSLPADGVQFVTSLRRGRADWHEMMSSVARLFTLGASIDWAAIDRGGHARPVPLPTYPFERKSYWIGSGAATSRRAQRRVAGGGALRPSRLPVAAPLFETILTPRSPGYLAEHRLNGAVLVAGPVMLEMVQSAASMLQGSRRRAVEGFSISNPLVLPQEGRTIQVQLREAGPRLLGFEVFSSATDDAGGWTLHATGSLRESAEANGDSTAFGPSNLGDPYTTDVDGAAHYERLAAIGIELSSGFRTIRHGRKGHDAAIVTLELPGQWRRDAVEWAHPVLLDGVLQAAGIALPDDGDEPPVYLLSDVERLDLHGALPPIVQCRVRLRPAAQPHPAEWRADVDVLDANGTIIGSARGVGLRRASRAALARIAGKASEQSDGIHYRIDWQPVGIATAASRGLAAPAELLPALRDSFDRLALENGLSMYAALLGELDRLSLSHAIEALRNLGFDGTRGRRFTTVDEAVRLGVVAAHFRLFERLLDWLVEEGLLLRQGDSLEVAAPLPAAAVNYEELIRRFTPVDGELLTLQRCGPKLAEVLAGRQDPLQLLFPGGSFAEARKLYVESPFARTYNGALATALRRAISHVPAPSRLRVLEIGAGTGGTTTYVLPVLPADRCDYTFTDVSPLFLERAAHEFSAFPFVRRALLDIERDPATQGFQAGTYDVVIAANVLHATAELTETVRHARSLLAPGGWLLLLEGVAPQRWVDLTFGLTDGWWRFRDTALRPGHPLIARDAWRGLLHETGFVDVQALPGEDSSDASRNQQVMFLARAPVAREAWTIIGDASALGDALAQRLISRGDTARVQTVADGTVPESGHVVYLGAAEIPQRPATDTEQPDVALDLALARPLNLLAALSTRVAPGRAWFVTRGVQAAGSAITATAACQAPLIGLGRGFALEHPDRWGGLIDLPAEMDSSEASRSLLAVLDGTGDEDQLALRANAWLAPRLVHAALPDAPEIKPRADATYLVTGAFGGLGALVARWIVARGARNVALLGRTATTGGELQRQLEEQGARVWVLRADVADETSLGAALAALAQEAPALRGILHAAADLNAGPIRELAPDQLARMMRPKLHGTLLLERLTRSRELDFLALFSSTTALLGAAGLAHYAAANAFLDAFALAHDKPGRRVLSVNWGTWEVMRLASQESQREYRASGLEPLRSDEALEALGRLLSGGPAQAVVARVDWPVLKALHETRRPRPFLRMLGAHTDRTGDGVTSCEPTLSRELSTLPPADRRDCILRFVSTTVAEVLGRDLAEGVPPAAGLFELGMDSLMSVELRRRLEAGVGRSLPSTLTFNYPNVEALTGYLDAELSTAGVVAQAPTVAADTGPEIAPAQSDVELDELSDDELEARLLARLSEVR